MKGEIFLYNRNSRQVQKVISVGVPRRWAGDSTRFTIYPRFLPNGELIFRTMGCPQDNPNCTEAHNFRYIGNGKYDELPDWPVATEEESRNLRQCTSYLTYEDGKKFVNVGPTGGPWQPILLFENHNLVPIGQNK